MYSNYDKLIAETEKFVQGFFQDEGTGHDWWHTCRVRKLAVKIARKEKADLFIVEMAALLHDVGDYKLYNGNEEKGWKIVREFLNSLSISEEATNEIVQISSNISYMKSLSNKEDKKEKNESLEFMIVSDADRLDAMGAIGIARAFTYGGFYHRPIYDPCIKPNINISREEYKKSNAPTINHFYEKLLKLKDTIYTAYGKKLAAERHYFLEEYLKRFFAEWQIVK